MHIVILLGHVPRHVRFMKTNGQKEWLIVGFVQFGDTIVRDVCVRNGRVISIDDSKLYPADAAIVNLCLSLPIPIGTACAGPLLWKSKSTMPQFAHS